MYLTIFGNRRSEKKPVSFWETDGLFVSSDGIAVYSSVFSAVSVGTGGADRLSMSS